MRNLNVVLKTGGTSDDGFVLFIEHGSRVLRDNFVGRFYEFAAFLDFVVSGGHLVSWRLRPPASIASCAELPICREVDIILYIVNGYRFLVNHLQILSALLCKEAALGFDGHHGVLYGEIQLVAGFELVSYIQLLEPFRKAMGIYTAAMGAPHCVRAAVGLASKSV